MPSLFRLFGYVIFFWSNEGAPLEPVHVHVAKGVPNASATKIWITEAGGCIVANNNSKIPARTLSAIVDVLESRSSYIGHSGMMCLVNRSSTADIGAN